KSSKVHRSPLPMSAGGHLLSPSASELTDTISMADSLSRCSSLEGLDLSPGSASSDRRSYAEVTLGADSSPAPVGGPGPRVASIVVAPTTVPAAGRGAVALLLALRVEPAEEGWRLGPRDPVIPARKIRKELPKELAGRCFNCLAPDHVAAACRKECRCRRCFESGHLAKRCPFPRPAFVGVPSCGAPGGGCSSGCGGSSSEGGTGGGRGSPGCGCPSARGGGRSSDGAVCSGAPGAPDSRPRREYCVVPRSAEIQAAEDELAWGLVGSINGGRRRVALSEARGVICRACPTVAGHFSLHKFWPADFLCVFDSRGSHYALLAAGPAEGSGFSLRFSPWNRQLQASLRSLWYRVVLELEGIPAHAWNTNTASAILWPACWVERRLCEDMGRFSVFAWTADPSGIAREMTLGIPDPPPTDLMVGDYDLCLSPEDIIPLSVAVLDYPVIIHLPSVEDRTDPFTGSSVDRDVLSGEEGAGLWEGQFGGPSRGHGRAEFLCRRGVVDGDSVAPVGRSSGAAAVLGRPAQG
ncbi:LOW QUALITY PROTEIN: hypothetical protein BRADI_3g32386v3, partial [Brachypodium distachyon]